MELDEQILEELKKLNKSLVVKMPAVGEPPFKEVSVFWLLNNNLEEIHKEIKHYDKRFETSFGIHEINQNQIKSFINNRFEVIMANIESLIKINNNNLIMIFRQLGEIKKKR